MMLMAQEVMVIWMKSNAKKSKNNVGKIFSKLYKLVDVAIVTPISTVVYKIQNKIGKESKIEKLLNRSNALLILSLLFAVALFYLVDNKAITLVNNDAKFLTDIPVEVEYNSSAYVIEGIPETVDMTLIGSKSEIYLAQKLGDNRVTVDLTKYQASDSPVRVKLSYNKPVDSVEYKIDPVYVTVTIKEKVSDNKTVSYDLLNQDELDPKLSVKSVELSKSDVIVRGSKEMIESIANIKALIDLDNDEFTKAGTYTLENLKLVAYGRDGNIINNVEIVATNISAKIELNSYSKKVPVRVQIKGELASGKAISSIMINGENVSDFETTIYGDESALEDINYIPVTIDADGQGNNGSKTSKVTFSKPAGVRSIADENVTVVLNFGEAKQRTIRIEGIQQRNVPNGLLANLPSADDKIVEVQVVGVESVINAIDENNPGISAYVDLTGKSVGTYPVSVMIEGTDSRLQYVVKKQVNIVLTKQN